jgi:hypothetical protein
MRVEIIDRKYYEVIEAKSFGFNFKDGECYVDGRTIYSGPGSRIFLDGKEIVKLKDGTYGFKKTTKAKKGD